MGGKRNFSQIYIELQSITTCGLKICRVSRFGARNGLSKPYEFNPALILTFFVL